VVNLRPGVSCLRSKRWIPSRIHWTLTFLTPHFSSLFPFIWNFLVLFCFVYDKKLFTTGGRTIENLVLCLHYLGDFSRSMIDLSLICEAFMVKSVKWFSILGRSLTRLQSSHWPGL
jgi:hypothetical protein